MLVLVFVKLASVMWSSSSINKQIFDKFNSSSVSLLANVKSRDLWNLLKYLNRTTTSALKDGWFVRGCWCSCASGPGCAGRSGLASIFLRKMKHYHQHHQFRLYNNYINFLISLNDFDYILRLYIGITISKSSTFSINVLSIFVMHDRNIEPSSSATSF